MHHSGGVGILKVDKSNVLGFSMDFAEDVTKSNWGVEFTWVEGLHVGDNDDRTGSPTASTCTASRSRSTGRPS